MIKKISAGKSKSNKTLSEWCREAAECNLDYGNYRALIEHCGKTYKELKDTADTRCVKARYHSRRWL